MKTQYLIYYNYKVSTIEYLKILKNILCLRIKKEFSIFFLLIYQKCIFERPNMIFHLQITFLPF